MTRSEPPLPEFQQEGTLGMKIPHGQQTDRFPGHSASLIIPLFGEFISIGVLSRERKRQARNILGKQKEPEHGSYSFFFFFFHLSDYFTSL